MSPILLASSSVTPSLWTSPRAVGVSMQHTFCSLLLSYNRFLCHQDCRWLRMMCLQLSICPILWSSSTQVVEFILRKNGTPPLCEILPFKINNENDLTLKFYIFSKIDNFCIAQSVLMDKLVNYGSQVQTLHLFYFLFLWMNFINAFLCQIIHILKYLLSWLL